MVLQRIEELAIRQLSRLAERYGHQSGMPKHLETGLEGEQEALFFLRRRGYTVVARRWTSAKVRGDLDLVAWHGKTLSFVEIKTRTTRDAVPAESAVDQSKRSQLRKLARVYLSGFPEQKRREILTRFDVVSIYLLPAGAEFEILESAFGWSERRVDAR